MMKQNRRNDYLLYGVLFNALGMFGLIIYLGLFQNTENKTVFVSGEKPEERVQILKGHICKAAFDSFANGNPNSDFIHPEIIKYLKESESEAYKITDIKEVFTSMTSRDNCRVIFKRESGFSGLNVVLTSLGPLGYQVTSLEDITLNVNDVRSYL